MLSNPLKETFPPLLLAAVLLCVGCAKNGDRPADRPRPPSEPQPVLDLAGQARARRLARLIPPGERWSEALQPGDYVLENAFVRFAIGGAGRRTPAPFCAGAVVAAALQHGTDGLRALVPQPGEGAGWNVTCREVRLVSSGGTGEAAQVTSRATLAAHPHVSVRTDYTLQPGARNLLIHSRISNTGEARVDRLPLADVLFPGPTERYAEGPGLHPAGRSGQSRWLGLFSGQQTWMITPDRGVVFHAVHRDGYSRLVYSRQTVHPGVDVTYSRRLWVGHGGVPIPTEDLHDGAQVAARVVDRTTDEPVENAYVELISKESGGQGLIVTGADGRGATRVPAGRYRLGCRAAGRSPFGTDISLRKNSRQELRIPLPAPARLRVRVLELREGREVPTAGRLTIVRASRQTPQPDVLPGVSALGTGRTALVPESGALEVPLPAASSDQPGRYLVAASKGPLHTLPTARIEVQAGSTTEARLVLRRAIEIPGYAAVDFAQADQRSPASALTGKRRVLLNRCEGIEGAVLELAGRWWTPRERLAPENPLIPAGAVSSPPTGPLSVLPSGSDFYRRGGGVPVPGEWGDESEEVFGLLRRYFPRSLVLLKNPHAAPTGYFRRLGFLPTGKMPAGYSPGFDGLLATAGSLRQLLPDWFALLNRGQRVALVAGSGSGDESHAPRMSARTYVRMPGWERGRGSLPEVILRLKETPAAFVSTAPLVHLTVDGHPVGSTVRAKDGTVTARLRVEAATWVPVDTVTLYRSGEKMMTWSISNRRTTRCLDQKLEIPVRRGGWVAATVSGEKNMAPVYADPDGQGTRPFAVTNPIWINR